MDHTSDSKIFSEQFSQQNRIEVEESPGSNRKCQLERELGKLAHQLRVKNVSNHLAVRVFKNRRGIQLLLRMSQLIFGDSVTEKPFVARSADPTPNADKNFWNWRNTR